MDQHWTNFINQEKEKQYYLDLTEFLSKRKTETTILPAPNKVFECFRQVNFNHMKVVIIGQDPYPNEKDACGVAFSSPSKERPYSLQNIFKEIYDDYFYGGTGGAEVQVTNDLTQWCEQGVLLLNSALTCEKNTPNAHKGKGWELFTENLIKYICEKHKFKLVFMLWGAQAKKFKSHITGEHLILEADHPAAVRHNPKAWFGNKHFTKANKFITDNYGYLRAPINWGTY